MTSAQLMAWAVHLYTASGAVLGFLALRATGAGDYQEAFAWLSLATLIDSTDGTLARRCRVKHVLPNFDGARLDDIVDYLNYVLVPIVLAHHAGLLPIHGATGIAALPLLASAYGFCQSDAKTADHYFKGFPSYWNIVVLYLYALRAPQWFNAVILVFLSVMVFVPIRYLYPSRMKTARTTTYALGIVWALLVVVLLTQFPTPSRFLAILSLYFPAYYIGLSLRLHFTTPAAASRL